MLCSHSRGTSKEWRIRLRIGRIGKDKRKNLGGLWSQSLVPTYTIVYTQGYIKGTKLCLETWSSGRTSHHRITAICTQQFYLSNFLWATDQDSKRIIKQSHYLLLVWRLPFFTVQLMLLPECVFFGWSILFKGTLLIYLPHPGCLSRSDVWNQWLWNHSQPF